jgi:hypothetical protein
MIVLKTLCGRETALRAAVKMKRKLFEPATEPIQNSGAESKELLIGHRRKDETTQNFSDVVSKDELYST